jgi:hypothetical protein
VTRIALLAVLAAACGEDEPQIPLLCDGVVERVPGEAALHVAQGTAIEWSTNPPATGAHYPLWVRWNHHYTSLDRGYWVHNAEHGGIILLYRCPDTCPDVVASLLDAVRAFRTDTRCQPPVRNRLIVVNDPQLPEGVQVAAVGWNATYTASCFDPYIHTFIAERYNRGPEDLCNDGIALGGTFIE